MSKEFLFKVTISNILSVINIYDKLYNIPLVLHRKIQYTGSHQVSNVKRSRIVILNAYHISHKSYYIDTTKTLSKINVHPS